MEKLDLDLGRDLLSLKEHDLFFLIHTVIVQLKRVEYFEQTNELSKEESATLYDFKRHAIITINMAILQLKFSDTIIKDSGELIPGARYYSWYNKWLHWLNQMSDEDWRECDRLHSEKKDITGYLPAWYNTTED